MFHPTVPTWTTPSLAPDMLWSPAGFLRLQLLPAKVSRVGIGLTSNPNNLLITLNETRRHGAPRTRTRHDLTHRAWLFPW